MNHIQLSIVAPCFNEAPVLREFARRASAAAEGVAPNSYELVLVDDGSSDDTPVIMEALAQQPNVIAVRLFRNHGHEIATSVGLSYARGQRVLLIDSDLQDPPELLPKMMDLMDQGADVVYGKRLERAGETWFKKASARAFYRILSSLSDTKIPRDTGDFRLMQQFVVQALCAMPEQQRFVRGMVSWIGGKQVPIEYNRHARAAGISKYPLQKLALLAVDAITSFSVRPLRFAIWIAIFSAMLALFFLAYGLIQWFANGTIQGWTSLFAAICLFNSIQCLILGIIGEYVGRIFVECKRRPMFLIRSVTVGGRTLTPSANLSAISIGNSVQPTNLEFQHVDQ